MLTVKSAIAANRFGLGARPGDAERIGSDPKGWLEAQLDSAARSAPTLPDPPESARVLGETRNLQAVRQAAAARARASASGAADEAPEPAKPQAGAKPQPHQKPQPDAKPQPGAAAELRAFVRDHYMAQTGDRYRRAVETDAPFVERLVHFWSNHFAISADKKLLGAIAGLYEEEAIRPHVTGRFLDMLMGVEQHPAMLLYLDNAISMGPSSAAARLAARRGRDLGLNENLGREIMELHTLGVDGGYDQKDVTEFAKVLTGWSIGAYGPNARRPGARGGGTFGAARDANDASGDPGEFDFRPAMHEPGDKSVLGKRYREDGVHEGEAVLETLAMHPATARHLATKLARHFVADDPPAALVDRLSDAYLRHGGELVPVYRALLDANESWDAPLAKYKTPEDFVISAYRALGGHAPNKPQQITAFLAELGQRPFTPGSPAGWPDTAASWDGSDALLKRIEWGAAAGRVVADRVDPAALADAVLGAVASKQTMASIRGAESASQGLAILLAAPEFQRR
ncbi:MAG TPA: DUF1800 domain-containing protein [Gammaproteobacteria bacterium]|nr:DUF1800 domain-containing protein [Gammaproteobacteria bacterium]